MARKGGKYEMKDGKPVLIERTRSKPPKKDPKPKQARKGKGKSDSED